MRNLLPVLCLGSLLACVPPGEEGVAGGGEAGGSTTGGDGGGSGSAGGPAGGDSAGGTAGGEAGGSTAGGSAGATAGGSAGGTAGGAAGGAAGGSIPDAGPPTIGDNVGPGRFKVLFDATKAEQAGNADWVIDDNWPQPQPAMPMAETDWVGGYSAWGVALVRSGRFDLETLRAPNGISFGNTANPRDLVHYHAFVLPEPNIALTAAEQTALVEYVRAGGGLFLIGNHGGSDRNNDGIDSAGVINALATAKGNPFGITLAGDNFYQAPCRSVNEDPTSTVLHGDFGDAGRTTYYNGSMLRIDAFANATARPVFWRNNTYSGVTNVLMAQARFGKGRVVVSGDSSAPDDGTGRPAAALQNSWTDPLGDNAVLFPNATLWLADGRCTNGARDPGEADVDCGGRCGPCAAGRACTANADCSSELCGAAQTCSGITLDRIDAPCRAPSVRVDGQGRIHATWAGNTAVAYGKLAAGAWELDTVTQTTSNVYSTRLALDSSGSPHAFWYEAGVQHATPMPGPWLRDTAGSWYDVWGAEVDAQGRPTVLANSGSCNVTLAVKDGAAWSTQTFDGGPSTCSSGGLAFDRAGRPNAAWSVYAPALNSTPRFAVVDGGTWLVEQPPAVTGYTYGLALDSNDQPHVVLHEIGYGLRHVYRSGTTWSVEPVPGGTNNSTDEVIGVDPAGVPYIAFADRTPDAGVFLSRRTPAGWVTERIARSGSDLSLAFRGPGQPVVAFCEDRPPYTLVIAH